MNPRHHPDHGVLIDFATGALGAGPNLVIRAHLGACGGCRDEVALAEAAGGALLNDLPPADMRADALAQALARIERPSPSPGPPPAPFEDWIVVPPDVLEAARHRRRWAAPGVWVSPVTGNRGGRRSYLLRVGAGMGVPRHSHRGGEMVCVLKGAYIDGAAVFGPGDFAYNDDSVEHRPRATGDEECICLIAADSALIPRDWIGRLFQPIVRI